jgi:hypothetical protein
MLHSLDAAEDSPIQLKHGQRISSSPTNLASTVRLHLSLPSPPLGAHPIPAFALNVGKEKWQADRVSDAYDAAGSSGSGFKLFLSFDMTSMAGDASAIRNYLNAYARHPSQFRLDGKPLASTFAGQDCDFGERNADTGWTLALRSGVCVEYLFVPAFFVDPRTLPEWHAIDGIFHVRPDEAGAAPLTDPFQA